MKGGWRWFCILLLWSCVGPGIHKEALASSFYKFSDAIITFDRAIDTAFNQVPLLVQTLLKNYALRERADGVFELLNSDGLSVGVMRVKSELRARGKSQIRWTRFEVRGSQSEELVRMELVVEGDKLVEVPLLQLAQGNIPVRPLLGDHWTSAEFKLGLLGSYEDRISMSRDKKSNLHARYDTWSRGGAVGMIFEYHEEIGRGGNRFRFRTGEILGAAMSLEAQKSPAGEESFFYNGIEVGLAAYVQESNTVLGRQLVGQVQSTIAEIFGILPLGYLFSN